jgi:hypothetical protein
MLNPLTIVAHHSEGIDPTLWEWIQHQLDELIGFSPGVMVLVFGLIIVVIPVGLLFVALRAKARISE